MSRNYDLCKMADELLRQNGCAWDGRTMGQNSRNYLQNQFERKMQTGAYSRCDNSRRKY